MALGERLTELAEREKLGAWIVALRTDRHVRAMEPEIAKILRDAQQIRGRLAATDGFIRPGFYTSDELMRLPRREWSSYVAEHHRVKELGIVELKPISSERENVIRVVPSRTDTIPGFSPELLEVLEAKREVLGQETDLERHLGVLVERWDRSNEPEDTPVPEIPPEIDSLWIVHSWRQGLDQYPVWVARHGDAAWRVYPDDGEG
jgi:hypothetical protein